MSTYNKEYILYIKKTISLVLSFVLKSEHTAKTLNEWVHEQGFTIQYENPETWLYYLNLNGKKHEANTPIYISSLDTLSLIEFTRENLLKHRNTLKEYQKLGEFYDELVEKNPNEMIYIRGVLDPVDIDYAISSVNGTILFHNSDYVDANEVSLIPTIQLFIYRYYDNWYNEGYHYTDDWYEGSFLMTLAASTLAYLYGIRLNNIGTGEVSDFHLWAKLGGHYGLDEFRDYLPHKTANWLYRNIDWIRSNIGKNEVFYSLIENLLTDNKLTISNIILRQDESGFAGNGVAPIPLFKRDPLNTNSDSIGDDTLSPGYILNQTRELAEHNNSNYEDDLESVKKKGKFSPNNLDLTKELEITFARSNSFNSDNFLDDIFKYWAHAIYTDKYTTDVVIKSNTGEHVKVTQEQAFICWIYTMGELYTRPMYKIPYMYFYDVPRQYIMSFDYYRMNNIEEYTTDLEIREALKYAESMESIDNADEFAKRVETYANNKYHHYLMWARAGTYEGTIYTRILTNMFYIERVYNTAYTGMDYTTFFESIGLHLHKYSKDYIETLYSDIFQTCTGLDVKSLSSSFVWQERLIDAFERLIDYNVQVIRREDTSQTGGRSSSSRIRPLKPGKLKSHLSFNSFILSKLGLPAHYQFHHFTRLEMQSPFATIDNYYSHHYTHLKVTTPIRVKFHGEVMRRINMYASIPMPSPRSMLVQKTNLKIKMGSQCGRVTKII